MELANRDRIEARFARRMSALSSKHRRELEQLLGDPPDPRNVPDDYWYRVEKETESLLGTMLLLIFVASSAQHGGGRSSEAAGKLFAASQARQQATRYLSGVQRAIDAAGDRWRATMRAADAKQQARMAKAKERLARAEDKTRQARAASQTVAGTPATAKAEADQADAVRELEAASRRRPTRILKQEVRAVLRTSMGPAQAATIAATTTTSAAVGGGESGMDNNTSGHVDGKGYFNPPQRTGRGDADTWFTRYDGRVCPVCLPLHGKDRTIWGLEYPSGPPVHPSCRCWIHYEGEKLTAENQALHDANVAAAAGSGLAPRGAEDDLHKRIVKAAKERGRGTQATGNDKNKKQYPTRPGPPPTNPNI